MTHGCLLIRSAADKRGEITLHTYHTGMDIPLIIREAPAHMAVKRWYIAEEVARRVRSGQYESCTIEKVKISLDCMAADQYEYLPSLAALLIATRPGMLEPALAPWTDDLPTWSGLETPYHLNVSGNGWWEVRGKSKRKGSLLFKMNPLQAEAEELLLIAKWLLKTEKTHLPEAYFGHMRPEWRDGERIKLTGGKRGSK